MNTKFKIGEKVIYKNTVEIVAAIVLNKNGTFYTLEHRENNCCYMSASVPENNLKKYEQILDNTEKRYLKNVIKPFKDRVISISKKSCFDNEYIHIELPDNDCILLPYFKKNIMYKGMKKREKYTLKELGLFEEDK